MVASTYSRLKYFGLTLSLDCPLERIDLGVLLSCFAVANSSRSAALI
jgi:hypothetical protein